MRAKTYETQRLRLLPSSSLLAEKAADYYQRNRVFLQPTEVQRDEAFYTAEFQRHTLEEDEKNARELRNVRFWVQLRQTGGLVGTVALNNIVMGAFRSAFLSYKLDEAYLRQGLATEAVRKVISVAFEEIGLHRLEANIMPGNTASLGVVKKLGFYNEGLAKKYLLVNGKWEDDIHMVLLNEWGTAG